MDGEHITADNRIADLAAIIEDAPPERQIEHNRIHRRPCDRSTAHIKIVPRPPVPREPGDELRVAAVRMAERGFPVFEVRPGIKLPCHGGWQRGQVHVDNEDGTKTWVHVPGRAASNNPAAAWRRWTTVDGSPADYNVGIFTDELLVLDFDAGHDDALDAAESRLCVDVDRIAADAGYIVLDSAEAWAAWRAAEPGAKATSPFRTLLDSTFTVDTPSGGRHYYFSMPAGQRAKGSVKTILPPGPGLKSCIDVRAAGNLVVGAGSRTEKGTYTVARDCPVMEAPAALIALCGRAAQAGNREQRDGVDWGAETVSTSRLDEGRRYLLDDKTPVSVEGQGGNATAYKAACGLFDRGVAAADTVSLLTEHWNQRCEPPWDDDELRTIVQNAFTYATGSFGRLAADVMFAGIVLPEPERPAPTRAARVQFLADQGELAPPQWLVKGLLPRVGVGLLAGQSRVGKSFLAHDLCGAVASGSPFFGHKVRERFATLYIAAEGAGTAPRRLEALRLHKLGGVDRTTLPIAYASLGTPCTPGNVSSLRDLISEATAALQHRSGPRLGLVVLDTVAAAFADLDENDNSQATTVMTALGSLAADCGLLLVAVHHHGKDAGTGPRGASAWIASADVILSATGTVNEATGVVKGRKLALSKARDGEQKPLSDYELQQVHMGVDEDGDAVTSAVVQAVTKAAQALVKDTPNRVLLRECFDLLAPEDFDQIEGVKWAKRAELLDVWKQRYASQNPAEGVDKHDVSNVRRAFNDALKACVRGGSVGEREHCGRNYVRSVGSATGVPADLF